MVKNGHNDMLFKIFPALLITLMFIASCKQLGKDTKEQQHSAPKFNRALASKLDSIYTEDQKYRLQLDSIENKHGWKSKEIQDVWQLIKLSDSSNLVSVDAILQEHGWLGRRQVGEKGSSALFLVIQHADIETKEKYLPLLQKVVEQGDANGSNLALLTDRIALSRGRKQIYGSQLEQDPKSQTYVLSPLEDPDHVDERRAKMDMEPIADYLQAWDIVWDVEAFKKTMTK